ncbi:MAG: GDP-L-fucose synthase [Alphaproteobacteria bacterium]|nr:MAG: GDP-L-fucose synthase [Alphaproteobacteria bacterium]
MTEIRPLDPPFRLSGRRVFVAGHRGMVGAALMRRLAAEDCELLTAGRESVDLRRQAETEEWMAAARPEVVFLAAARVGGILANSERPAEFIYDNLAIETNVIEAARRAGVAKLVFLGSSCIYPKFAEQPMREEALLTGALEPTNEPYAVAKIAGLVLCRAYRRQYGCDFVSAMPTNLYGPGDNFDLRSSHVLPALIRKIDAAAQSGADTVEIWGSGTPRREFLHVDDLADGLVHLAKRYSGEMHVNLGTGEDVTIAELAQAIARIVGFEGRFVYDATKPDGTPRKLLDVTRMSALGWRARIPLEEGIRQAWSWYRENVAEAA